MRAGQGPQICLILGHLCWSSKRRSVDPEPSLKGLRSAERGVSLKMGPRTDSLWGVRCGPASGCPAYIYMCVCIYIYICVRAVELVGDLLPFLEQEVVQLLPWSPLLFLKSALATGGTWSFKINPSKNIYTKTLLAIVGGASMLRNIPG